MTIASNYPSIRPSLLLDFANTKQLDPRITFSRASTGTYYDGKTVVKAEENLFTYSQEFDNAAWTKGSITVTANQGTAPDGTTTADRIVSSGASFNIRQAITTVSSAPYVLSLWVKSNTGSSQTFRLYANNTSDNSADLTATTDWQRFTFTFNGTGSSGNTGLRNDVAGTAIDLLIWGAQLEQRSTVTAYTPTTTQPITNYIPALQTAAAGVARFDHDPVTGESLGLEIEELRTNLVLRSEDFDNAYWVKTRTAVIGNTIVAPDGNLVGDKIIETTDSGIHLVNSGNITVSIGTVYTFSIFAKAGERNLIGLGDSTGNSIGFAIFNLSTGAVTFQSGGSSAITPVGNGWYRCTYTSIAAIDVTINCTAYLTTSATSINSYAGDGYSGLYIWGAQLEAGSFPTSYIPTVASQVTRSADSASMTGSNFSSWYSNGQGSLFADINRISTTGYPSRVRVWDGTSSNVIDMYFDAASNSSTGQIITNGTSQAAIFGGGGTRNEFIKAAIAWETNNIAVSYGGNIQGADTSCIIASNINSMVIAGGLTGYVKRIAYYPKRLSNTELQAITS